MATLAHDIFCATKSPDTGARHDWHKYFLYCVTIELGLKAALLNNNNTAERKKGNKNKIGHNIKLLRNEAAALLPADFFNSADEAAIDQISEFFSDKGLEYVTVEFLVAVVSRGKGIPPIDDLEAAAGKVAEYMEESRFFRSSDTRP
jgi:hypothetical protein